MRVDRTDRPILVFDSGVGGISVLRALVRILPRERFVYFGDSANAPYGPRGTPEIRELTLGNLRTLDQGFSFKAAVIACNTATSAAITELRAEFPDRPIIGIEPALKLAADRHPGQTVVVLATETTLREAKFAALTKRVESGCRVVGLACPELVEYVERGQTEGPELEAYLRDRLAPFTAGGAAAVVLGCTHFPFVKKALRKVLQPDTELLDGSEGTARQTKRLLAQRGLLSEAEKGKVEFYSSKPGQEILLLCRRLFEVREDTELPGELPDNDTTIRMESYERISET